MNLRIYFCKDVYYSALPSDLKQVTDILKTMAFHTRMEFHKQKVQHLLDRLVSLR